MGLMLRSSHYPMRQISRSNVLVSGEKILNLFLKIPLLLPSHCLESIQNVVDCFDSVSPSDDIAKLECKSAVIIKFKYLFYSVLLDFCKLSKKRKIDYLGNSRRNFYQWFCFYHYVLYA